MEDFLPALLVRGHAFCRAHCEPIVLVSDLQSSRFRFGILKGSSQQSRLLSAEVPVRRIVQESQHAPALWEQSISRASGKVEGLTHRQSAGAFSFLDLRRMMGYAGLSKLLEISTMARGTVKWFNGQKGYGFIQPEDGGRDVFVHISAVERAGLPGLNEGQTVEYEEVTNRGKTSAENLKALR